MAHKKHTYVWRCCTCGCGPVPIQSGGCPQCGSARCANCATVRVHLKGYSTSRTLKKPGPKPRPASSKCRRGLPILFAFQGGHREVMAGYDTGTHANHISLKLALSLGYEVDPEYQSSFRLPSGKTIKAVGRITANIRFARGDSSNEESSMTCQFNVFKSLAVSTLFGMSFLDATQTLSKHTTRLVKLPIHWKRQHHLFSMGAGTNEVPCFVDGELVGANADTGSEIALISSTYAAARNLTCQPGWEALILADGSLEYTTGFVDILLTLPVEGAVRAPWKKIRFHVLETHTFDLILDEELVNDFAIFEGDSFSLVEVKEEEVPTLAPIIHLGPFEKIVDKAAAKAKDWTQSLLTAGGEKKMNQSNEPDTQQKAAIKISKRREAILQKVAELDQEENRQCHWASKQGYTLGQALIESQRQARYETRRNELVAEYWYWSCPQPSATSTYGSLRDNPARDNDTAATALPIEVECVARSSSAT